MNKLLKLSDVLAQLKIKRTSFYYLRKSGAFPEPIYITNSKKGMRWREEDIEYFLEQREKLKTLINA